MKFKKQNFLYILGGGMLIFFLLWVHSEIDNHKYEHYLSYEMVTKIVHLSSAPPDALSIMEDVLDKGEMTNAQAGELESSFQDLAFDTQDINQMDMYLGRLGKYNDDLITAVNADYHDFFMMLREQNDKIALTKGQIEKINKMKELMRKYNGVVQDTLKYTVKPEDKAKGQSSKFWDYYEKQGIKDDYWVNLIKGYMNVTDNSDRIN